MAHLYSRVGPKVRRIKVAWTHWGLGSAKSQANKGGLDTGDWVVLKVRRIKVAWTHWGLGSAQSGEQRWSGHTGDWVVLKVRRIKVAWTHWGLGSSPLQCGWCSRNQVRKANSPPGINEALKSNIKQISVSIGPAASRWHTRG